MRNHVLGHSVHSRTASDDFGVYANVLGMRNLMVPTKNVDVL